MKKTDSNPSGETIEQKVKRLEKENAKLKAKLKSQKEADKAKIENLRKEIKKSSKLKARSEADKAEISALKKELKKKEEPRLTKADELIQSILSRLPDIDSPSR